MSKKSRGIFLSNLEITEHWNAIPMAGWHSPIAEFTHENKEWRITIAGGCQSIWLTSPSGRSYSISIGELLPFMVKKIEEIEKEEK